MNRTEIIEHYKSFFSIENMELGEDDHLIIDWAEALIKDFHVPDVSGSLPDDKELATEVIVRINGAKWMQEEILKRNVRQ